LETKKQPLNFRSRSSTVSDVKNQKLSEKRHGSGGRREQMTREKQLADKTEKLEGLREREMRERRDEDLRRE